MPVYKAPVEDTLFLLNDVFAIERYNNLPGFADATPDVIEAVLGEGAKLCEEVLQPLNLSGDKEGCTRHADGRVSTPKGFKAAHEAYAQGGWIGLAMDPDYGGQGLPYTLGAVMNEFSSSANMAFAMYPGLTMGAIAALNVHGSDEQKRTYLPKMIEGVWSGTMNLTEPHCGTDLGLIKHQGRAQRRRLLFHHRHQDLHLGRRAGHHREHHPPRARPHRGRARRRQGHLALRRADVNAIGADGAVGERNHVCLRLDRAQDGHSRQRHLRHELRRGEGLADRRPRTRACNGHVRDDERGPARRRHPGAGTSPRSPTRTPWPMRRTASRAAR